jgi:hypothetical protein
MKASRQMTEALFAQLQTRVQRYLQKSYRFRGFVGLADS